MANQNPEGILLVDKPAGPTSFDIIAQTRREFQTKAVGHTGTLDPFATGLLVLLLGRYTRLSEYLTAQDKTYEATICLGIGTDTDDCEGQVIAQTDASHISSETIEIALQSFLGEQMQVPPQYSAISIGGERAYKKARRGEQVAYEPRPIHVYEIGVIPSLLVGEGQGEGCTYATFRIKVSKGTYIRAIARDLGTKLGVPAHLTALRRTACGPYNISEVTGELLTGIESIRGIPLISIDTQTAQALRNGQRPPSPLEGEGRGEGSIVSLTHLKNEPIALVKIEQGRLVSVRGF